MPRRSSPAICKCGDIGQQDRHAVLADADGHLRQIVQALEISAAADHVFVFAHLHDRSADVVVGSLNRGHDRADGKVVRQQSFGLENNLVFLDESADGRDFRDIRYGGELITEIPVLKAAQACQILIAGDQRLRR